jgi:chromosome partitioning protein
MVITFAGEKGGPGKSALSYNLAVCMQLRKLDVLLIDGDLQRTTAKWAERRAQLGHAPIPCVERRGDMLAAVESLAPKYDHVIIDVRGAQTPQLDSALASADIVYSPFTPDDDCLETAEEVHHRIEMIRKVINPGLRSWAIANKVTPQSAQRELETVAEYLADYPLLPTAATWIGQRRIFRKAHAAKRGVVEFMLSPSSTVRRDAREGARELWNLYTEITGDLVAMKDYQHESENRRHCA